MSGKFPPPTHDTLLAQAARLLRPGRGCFPLCEGCWTLLGHPEARIEYYATMVEVWAQDGHDVAEDRRAIGRAVAAGG